MVKAFLFDYGGVITDGGAGNDLSERLAHSLGITSEKAVELIYSGIWRSLLRGKSTEEQFWDKLEQNFGKTIPLDKRHIFNTWENMQPRPKIVELLKKLHTSYPVGLLSNVIPKTSKDIHAHGGYDQMDFLITSYETGYSKPEIEIYKLALAKLPGIEPKDVVFIDDQLHNLLPAQELGMQTILAVHTQQIIQDIENLLT
jgi:epoxide hydrolase-like predicted phosphatase